METFTDYSDYISEDMEYSLIEARNKYKIPDEISDEEAIAIINEIAEIYESDRAEYLYAIEA